jgi:signal transduction histidine kinase
VPVELTRVPEDRLPDSIEVAIYYLVAEAITNVAKYAEATQASVAVERSNGIATVVVSDDGVGGAEPNSGSGLGWPHRSRRGTRWTAARRQPARPGIRLTAEIPCD